MPGILPSVSDGVLRDGSDLRGSPIAVDSVEWFAWLDRATTRSFAFHGDACSFTARKESRQRGSAYWSAYRSVLGRIRKAYLGTSAALTLERLHSASRALAATSGSTEATPLAPSTVPDIPFLRNKLFMPPPRKELVKRERLYRRVSEALSGRLLIITGAAGSGKTTLLSGWNAQRDAAGSSLAWLSLDEADNDPVRFWRALCATLDTIEPGLTTTIVALLSSARQMPGIDLIVAELIAALDTVPRDLILVLDDYHVISEPDIHKALARLIERLPPQIHLALTSRAEPPLPLARLRANGDLTELRADDLRFTHAEVNALVNDQLQLDLTNNDVGLLTVRTEGWAVGLHLAALALRGQPPARRSTFLETFSGSHRYIGDYLVEEVLDDQPATTRQFLLQTAILNRLNGPLCAALINDEAIDGIAATERLEELARAGMFLVPLDESGDWYRYHRLFADLLRKRFRQEFPDRIATLYLQASKWCADQKFYDEAIEYALAANDQDRAADLIERAAEATTIRNEHQTVQRWLAALPPDVIQSRPSLGLARAWMLALRFPSEETTAYLTSLETDPRYAPFAGELATYRATSLILRDLPGCIMYGERALTLLAPDQHFLRGSAAVTLGVAYWIIGDFANAERVFHLTIALNSPLVDRLTDANAGHLPPEQLGALVPMLTAQQSLGDIRRVQGWLRQAEELLVNAVNLAGGQAGPLLPVFGAASAAGHLASLRYEQNDLGEALRLLDLALAPTQRAIIGDQDWTLLRSRAQFAAATGDDASVQEVLRELDEVLERMNQPLPRILTSLTRLRCALAGNDHPRIERETALLLKRLAHVGVDHETEASPPHYSNYLWEQQEIELGRVALTRGHFAEVLIRADRVAASAERSGHHLYLIPANLLRALAHAAQGEERQALKELASALAQGEPEGYVRTFRDFGAPLRALLSAALETPEGRNGATLPDRLVRYSHRLLSTFAPGDPGTTKTESVIAPEQLTSREREILTMLADGLSNHDIAAHLFISRGTVKWHINRIFAKLGVRNRLGAVARGRALQILS